MKVSNLTVHRNTAEKRARQHVHGQTKRILSEIPRDADGVAVVWFRRDRDEGAPVVRSYATWSVRDPLDAHALPHLAFGELMKGIYNAGED